MKQSDVAACQHIIVVVTLLFRLAACFDKHGTVCVQHNPLTLCSRHDHPCPYDNCMVKIQQSFLSYSKAKMGFLINWAEPNSND